MTKTSLERLIGRTIDTAYCNKCDAFISLTLDKDLIKECPFCKNNQLEYASIKIKLKYKSIE